MTPRVLVPLVSIAIQAAIHLYLWRRLVRDPGLPPRLRRLATVGLVVLALSIPLTILLGRHVSPAVARWASWPGLLWMALAGLTFVALMAIDAVRLGAFGARRLLRRPAPVDPARRRFLARSVGGVAALAAGSQVGVGIARARSTPRATEVELRLARWPAALDGFRIVQLTDVHIGLTIDRDFVARLVDQIMAARPDLIALTGDLIDGSVAELRAEVAPLAGLRAPHGVYFVTGNHEFYAGADPWLAHLPTLGIRVLRNQRVAIAQAGAAFDLAGIEDYTASHYPGHGADLAAALAGRDPTRPLVLLAHQPRQVLDAARAGVDLQLSGHTHGGQIWPWHYVVRAQQGGLLAGEYQVGPTRLYVSRGAGYWGPPVRVLAPAELPCLVLRSSAAT